MTAIKGKLLNPDDVGYDLIVQVGQSNNEGRGTPIDTRLDVADNRIQQYGNTGSYSGIVSVAVEPLATYTASGTTPTMMFARDYLGTVPGNRRVLIVAAAKGGTPFEGASGPAGWTWKVGRSDVTNLYDAAIAQAQAALAAADAQFPGKNRIVGFTWVHGETDGDNLTSGATYQADLDALIDGFRTALNCPNAFFVIGGMVPEYLSTGTRTAIQAVHADTPYRKLRVGFAYGISGANQGDGNHYTSAGTRALGHRMFAALSRARSNILGTAPVAPGAPSLTQSGSTVTANWAQVTGRATDFNVRYSTDGGTTWATLTRTRSIDVSATITGLAQPSTLAVQVRTVNEQGNSAWSPSGAISLIAAPTAVTGLAAGTPAPYSVPLTWNAGSGGTSFLVEKSTDGGTTWATVATTAGPTSYTVTGLAPSTSHKFRVTASNAGGTAAPSNVVTVSTATAPMLIDSVTVASVGAWSANRKLRSAYAGSALRVRRSSDNTEQDIAFTGGGLVDTTALSTFVGAGSGYLTKLYDQSGAGKDMVMATVASQPRVVNAGALDATGGILFPVWDGVDDYLMTATGVGLYSAGAATMVAVVRGAAATTKRLFAEGHSTSGSGAYSLLGSMSSSASKRTAQVINEAGTQTLPETTGSLTLFDSAVHQTSVTDSGTSVSGWIDGAADGSASAYTRSGTLTPDRAAIGAIPRSTVSAFFGGSIPEVVTFASVLSTVDRQAAEANQKAYYSTP